MEKLTTRLVIFLFQFNNIEQKKYFPCKNMNSRDIYVFHSNEEYYNYFLENGVRVRDKELLDIAIFSKLKNGDIIALKGLCDYIIENVNRITEYDLISLDFQNDKMHQPELMESDEKKLSKIKKNHCFVR